MAAYIRVLTPDGLQPVDYAADSLNDAVQYEPQDGVYTVTNTYNKFQVLKLDAHLNRMEDSARRIDLPLTLDRPRLRAALRTMIAESGFDDVRFRITVGREHSDHLIITLEPFTPPAQQLIEQGVRCVTVPNSARENAAAKTTGWMHQRGKLVVPPEIYQPLLLDAEGNILEGQSSNFYAVLDGELRTAGSGVLPGIAQQTVFEIAPTILPLRKEAVNVRELTRLSEAFLTSSSRGIIPVVEIDGITIGAGLPGEKTKALQAAYAAWVRTHLEDL